MFTPNLVGVVKVPSGFNAYGQPIFGDAMPCPFAFVNNAVGAEKTSVRADSSASRGAADETATVRAKILVASYVTIQINSRFEFEGQNYLMQSVHPRRSVAGRLDHYECDLEFLS